MNDADGNWADGNWTDGNWADGNWADGTRIIWQPVSGGRHIMGVGAEG